MVTSASHLPKAKRSLLSLLVAAALAAGAFLLLFEDAPPLGAPAALRLELEEDHESRALEALADADTLPAHRALRREWFLIEQPDGKRKWRRQRWKWYKNQKKKGVTICRHKRKSKKATCQRNKTSKNQVQDATPPAVTTTTTAATTGTPPADKGNQDVGYTAPERGSCDWSCILIGGKGCVFHYDEYPGDTRGSVCKPTHGENEDWCAQQADREELGDQGVTDCGMTTSCDDAITPQCMANCLFDNCCWVNDGSRGGQGSLMQGVWDRAVCLGPHSDGHTRTYCPGRTDCRCRDICADSGGQGCGVVLGTTTGRFTPGVCLQDKDEETCNFKYMEWGPTEIGDDFRGASYCRNIE